MTQKLTTYIYFTTVFLTGAAVLIFEVAAVRMLAPYFGSSLYVLSSVLTIILAALSFGYFLGGRIADRVPHFIPLYTIIGGAGIIMLLLQTLSLYILPFSNQIFSIATGPLVLSLTLFFIPAFLLGIDSPFVIKLLSQTATPDHGGAVVGSTFFWSTVGSILGSILAGFFLIPYLGLTLTITMVSGGLIVWALCAISLLSYISPATAYDFKFPLPPLLLTAVVVLVGIALGYHTLTFKNSSTSDVTLYRADGFYSHLHIFDRVIGTTTYRFLKNDVNNSSAIIPGSNEIVFQYAQLANLFTDNVPDAKNYLVLGGGSYTIPRHMNLSHPNLTIDVVEVEPSLYPLAQQYFELPKTAQITNYPLDARVFLQSTSTKYDVIFSDVMNSGHFLPPHLSTVEFFESLRSTLAPNGIAIINFIGSLGTDEITLTGSMIRTITSVFPNHKIIALNDPTYQNIQNLVFVVRHEGNDITIPATTIKNPFSGTIKTADTLVVPNTTYNLSNQALFTDDKSLMEPLIFKQFAHFKR